MSKTKELKGNTVCHYQASLALQEELYRRDLMKKIDDPEEYWKSVLIRKVLKLEWVCNQLSKLTGKEYAVVILEEEREDVRN